MTHKPSYEELERRVRELEREILIRKRAEEALRGSEERYRTLVDTAAEGVWVIDAEARTTYVNPQMAEMLLYPVEEMIGRGLPEFLDEEYKASFQDRLKRRRRGEKEQYKLRFLRKDGTQLWGFLSASPLFGPDGGVVGSFAMVTDVTEGKRAEELLRSERQRLFSVLEMLPALVWLQARDHSVRYANSRFRQLLGDPEGRSCYEIFRGRKKPCSPCEPFRVFETTLPQQGEYRDSSGLMYEVHDSLFWDDDGSPLILEVAIDITERKMAEEALQESKAYLAATIESIPFEFWVMGPDGRYTMQNRICRGRYGDIIGKRPEDICPNERILSVWRDNNLRAFSGELVKGEVRFSFENEDLYFYNVVAPIHDHDKTCGIVGINVDITDRKLLEAALKKVNEELESQVEERTKELSAKTRRLEEFNAALKVLLKQREEDRTELEESILLNIKSLIVPYVEKLKRSRLGGDQMTYLTILESHMREIISPFAKRLSERYLGLTPVEVQAAGLIKEGKTTKEIAESLGISANTVSSHRFHIRKKLGLGNKKVNLRSYLTSLGK
ncbi:MAG: PAS domain S-box protein [Syntrophobacteraceae bacterium]